MTTLTWIPSEQVTPIPDRLYLGKDEKGLISLVFWDAEFYEGASWCQTLNGYTYIWHHRDGFKELADTGETMPDY